jgi:hypothetical protein
MSSLDSSVLLLQEFEVEIKDKRGTENMVADHLSRLELTQQLEPKLTVINESFLDERILAVFTNNFIPTWCGATPLLFLFSACFLFFFLLFPLSLSVLVPLGLSLYYLCLFIFRLCFFVLSVCGSPLLCGFCLFVLVSPGLYLVGWINNLR